MKGIRALSSATKLTVLGLTANAVGIWIQAFSGAPEYPTIPPGPNLLVVVAGRTTADVAGLVATMRQYGVARRQSSATSPACCS